MSECAVKRIVSLSDACFTVVYCSAAYSEFCTDFGLSHTVHIAVQYGKFQCGKLQVLYKLIIFAVIRLFVFKAIHGIHRQSLIIRKVYGFDDCSSPVRSVTKKIDEVIYFTIAGKFNRYFFSFAVFTVNLIGCMADELIQKADCRLRYVVAIRYDIVYLAHVVQVFD